MPQSWVKVYVHVPDQPMVRQVDGRNFENPLQSVLGVIDKLKGYGVGVVGNYDNVAMIISGEGVYRAIPGSGAVPSAGQTGAMHREPEKIVVFSAPKDALSVLLRELKQNHPYETPVIDIIDLVRHEFDCLAP